MTVIGTCGVGIGNYTFTGLQQMFIYYKPDNKTFSGTAVNRLGYSCSATLNIVKFRYLGRS